jgi:hypothetical protein
VASGRDRYAFRLVVGWLVFVGMLAPFAAAWAAYMRWQRDPRWSRFPEPVRPKESTPIADLPESGTASCRGRVVASDKTFVSPSGRSVVWFECVIRRHIPSTSEDGAAEEPPLVFRDASAFELEDGSGARVRVLPSGGYLLPDALAIQPSSAHGALRARLEELLMLHGKPYGPNHDLGIAESYLALGEEVTVRGAVRCPDTHSYRESARRFPVMTSDGEELFVWTPRR